MIGFLEGELLEKNPGQVLVKVGGVGYPALIPLSTFLLIAIRPSGQVRPWGRHKGWRVVTPQVRRFIAGN
jgi:hypothetical protein